MNTVLDHASAVNTSAPRLWVPSSHPRAFAQLQVPSADGPESGDNATWPKKTLTFEGMRTFASPMFFLKILRDARARIYMHARPCPRRELSGGPGWGCRGSLGVSAQATAGQLERLPVVRRGGDMDRPGPGRGPNLTDRALMGGRPGG